MLGVREAISIIAVAFMIGSGLMVLKSKSLVYAAVYLAFTASAAASIIALLGYTIVAVFQVAVYVGAAVLFIIIALTIIGGGEGEFMRRTKLSITASALASTSIIPLLVILAIHSRPEFMVKPDFYSISKLLRSDFGALVVVFIALAALAVQAIALARRGVRG